MPSDEHAWHACATPPPPDNVDHARWNCDICHQTWIWRRPPRPAAQWIRQEEET